MEFITSSLTMPMLPVWGLHFEYRKGLKILELSRRLLWHSEKNLCFLKSHCGLCTDIASPSRFSILTCLWSKWMLIRLQSLELYEIHKFGYRACLLVWFSNDQLSYCLCIFLWNILVSLSRAINKSFLKPFSIFFSI